MKIKTLYMEKLPANGRDDELTPADINSMIDSFLSAWKKPLKKALLIPPDSTRSHSGAGFITRIFYEKLSLKCRCDILPALGTHKPMTKAELISFFGGQIPMERFFIHNWRNDTIVLGHIPGTFIAELSGNHMREPIPVEVNRLLTEGYDLLLSIGQVVPHEVAGMANHSKNILVGCGGADFINASHMLSAYAGFEKYLGLDHSPVRKLFDYARENFLASLPIVYVLTVTAGNGNSAGNGEEVLCNESENAAGSAYAHTTVNSIEYGFGGAENANASTHSSATGKTDLKLIHYKIHGIYIGTERDCFEKAVSLSQKINITCVQPPIKTCVVYLDPEYKTAWLGNKAVYRTRKALEQGAKLIILTPGFEGFGEDSENDRLIRKYGYRGRERILALIKDEPDLKTNRSAAAHLIHGSPDGAFDIIYCTKARYKNDIESVGYEWGDIDLHAKRYQKLKDGWNIVNNEDVYYISNPALGLWVSAFCRGE